MVTALIMSLHLSGQEAAEQKDMDQPEEPKGKGMTQYATLQPPLW